MTSSLITSNLTTQEIEVTTRSLITSNLTTQEIELMTHNQQTAVS